MKKIICVFAIIILIILPSRVVGYAEDVNQETIKEQQKEFGIQNFIKNAKEYTGEFFEGIDISKILNISMNQVKVLIHRGKKMLGDILNKEDF